MNKKNNTMKLILMLIFSAVLVLSSCIMDRVTSLVIKNCTNDTLYLEFSDSDTLDNWIYWNRQPIDVRGHVTSEDTTLLYIKGEKVILDNLFCKRPGTVLFVDPHSFDSIDKCYLYAIKKEVVTHYLLEEIRAKKLYDRRTLTKKDFHDSMYEYRVVDTLQITKVSTDLY